MERIHNFSAGPGTLPRPVLEEARDEMLVYKTAGASIMEISHRSAEYTAVADAARQHFKDLLGLDDDWQILFLQGGASLQFYQTALNFLPAGRTADYVDTGEWSSKAIQQGQFVGTVNVAASSEETGYDHVPPQASWVHSENPAYVHVTSNNTIYGTRMTWDPDVPAPLICDASSDFLARPLDMNRYSLIYAGAQKNIGPAGVTVVLVRSSFMERANPNVPTMLDYRVHASKLFNTPPVFAVYMVEKVLRWLKDLGGLVEMERRNDQKARLLYDRLDRTDFYRGTAQTASRSNMNVTFRLPDEAMESAFIAGAKKKGLVGLKGHRSVGGIRASIYNACDRSSVEALIDFMDGFERDA
ncbi:MAG: 3-phosphoserine/phosphohydroxythreonine transaminase [Rhodothermales bacterium]